MPAIALAFRDSSTVTESIHVEVLRSLALPVSLSVFSRRAVVDEESVAEAESEVEKAIELFGDAVSTAVPVSVTVLTAIRTVVSVSTAEAPDSVTVVALTD